MAALVLLALNGAACDAFYTVHGRVESCASRQPLADTHVVVRITHPRKAGAGWTREDGTFEVGVNALPDDTQPSDVTVQKEGFKSAEIHVTNPTANQGICLTPTGAPARAP